MLPLASQLLGSRDQTPPDAITMDRRIDRKRNELDKGGRVLVESNTTQNPASLATHDLIILKMRLHKVVRPHEGQPIRGKKIIERCNRFDIPLVSMLYVRRASRIDQ